MSITTLKRGVCCRNCLNDGDDVDGDGDDDDGDGDGYDDGDDEPLNCSSCSRIYLQEEHAWDGPEKSGICGLHNLYKRFL